MLTIDYILVVYSVILYMNILFVSFYTTPIHGNGGPGVGGLGVGGIRPLNTPATLRRCSVYAAIKAVMKTLNAVS
jgi:hypothetical protein